MNTTTGDDNARSTSISRSSLLAFFRRWEWLLVLLILIVVLVNVRLSPFFLNVRNLMRATSDFMELGLMILPMVFVIITGNIDLSVASTLAMCASLLGWLHIQGVNIWIATAAALMLGLLAGGFNGYLVARVRLPSLVITLGTFAFYRGMAFALLGDQAARGYPADFTFLGQGTLGAIRLPFSALLFALLALIFGLVLHKTTFGRYLYVIGNNEEAARYSGVPVARVKMIIFMLSGFMSALAGVIIAARFGSTRPDIGMGLELAVITATVLGGINIFGGSGTMVGAILALVLIGLMRFGMGLVNVQGQVQSIAIGLLLIFSILLPNVAQQVARRHKRSPPLLPALVLLALGAAFISFFFWSRALILTP
ncbi:MAG TPA: ABC transporter permease [Candidatus Sulfomarinibacteraceae bacterium]|nr:ABC transporter permease [Candidatus Sulfomarinibacteraceae bacterium]